MKKLITIVPLIMYMMVAPSYGQETLNSQSQDSINNAICFKKLPLMVFDDKLIESNELKTIAPDIVQEITVIKENGLEKYISKYGQGAKDGIVLIYSKNYVAKRWYKDFTKFNKKLSPILNQEDFDYKNYQVYLNDKPLKQDFFDGLEKEIEGQKIKKVKFKSIKNQSIKGKITITTI